MPKKSILLHGKLQTFCVSTDRIVLVERVDGKDHSFITIEAWEDKVIEVTESPEQIHALLNAEE